MSFLSVGLVINWIFSIDTFHFFHNFHISSSTCMLLHKLQDLRCHPDLVEQIINRRIFLQATGSFIDIWCNIQDIFQFVAQKCLWYNCNRKLYCLNDLTYNWLKNYKKKFWITVSNKIRWHSRDNVRLKCDTSVTLWKR